MVSETWLMSLFFYFMPRYPCFFFFAWGHGRRGSNRRGLDGVCRCVQLLYKQLAGPASPQTLADAARFETWEEEEYESQFLSRLGPRRQNGYTVAGHSVSDARLTGPMSRNLESAHAAEQHVWSWVADAQCPMGGEMHICSPEALVPRVLDQSGRVLNCGSAAVGIVLLRYCPRLGRRPASNNLRDLPRLKVGGRADRYRSERRGGAGLGKKMEEHSMELVDIWLPFALKIVCRSFVPVNTCSCQVCRSLTICV